MDDLDLGSTVKGFSPGQKVFARYTLKKILGRGGMGVVWLARDDELEREVALKFLPEVVAMDSEALRDLKRETRRSLELTHPHVIRIYDFVQDERMAAISMEYVAGDTLAQRKGAQPEQCFDPAEILPWLTQLVEALDHAHRKAKVVHRDLKPANLMVDAHGDLKIADFGIAASVSDSVSRVSAQAGSSGTPVFMSPQQMMGEKPAVTDDIYSVGATLYDLLTSKPPFHSGNVVAQVQSRVAPSLADRRLELGVKGRAPIPAAWEQTIAACLAKDPAARPQTARELLDRLQGGGLPVPPAPVAARPPEPAKPAPVAASPIAAAPAAALPKISSTQRWWWAPFAASLPWSVTFFVGALREWLVAPDSEGAVLVIAFTGFFGLLVVQYAFFTVLLAIRRPWKVRSPVGIMVLGGALGALLGWGLATVAESVGVISCTIVSGLTGVLQGWLLHRLAVGVWPEQEAREKSLRPLTWGAAAVMVVFTVVFFSVVLPGWEHSAAEARRVVREEQERLAAEKERLRLEDEARLTRERADEAERLRLADLQAKEQEAERRRQAEAAQAAKLRAEGLRASEGVVNAAFRSVFNRAPSADELRRYAEQLAGDRALDAAWLRQTLRETPEGRQGGRVIVPDEFRTIREALDAAVPGNVIHVGPGTYREPIVLSKNVSLIGAGRERVIVESPSSTAALVASNLDGGVRISGFTFRHTDTNEQENRAAVVGVNSSNLRFEKNQVEASNGHGIFIRGTSKVVVQGNIFRRSRWTGIALFSSATGEIRENEVIENEQAGMAIYEPAPGMLIADNIFRANKHSGFWAQDATDMTFVGNRVYQNGVPGTNYGGMGFVKGNPRLRGNVAQDNVGPGIWFNAEVRARIEAGNVSDGQPLTVTP